MGEEGGCQAQALNQAGANIRDQDGANVRDAGGANIRDEQLSQIFCVKRLSAVAKCKTLGGGR
jgi:hypothetical protein